MRRIFFTALTFVVAAATGVGACADPQPPTSEEVRAGLVAERAWLDTMRTRAAAQARQRDSLHALSKSIDSSIDRTRLARIRELDSLLAQSR